MAHAPTSFSDRPQPAPRPAFTLVELLVVLAVIGLALVIAVPAFTSITEGRKESASQNLISAALSRARAEAIKLGQPAGVFFYYDTVNERSKLAIVTLEVDLTDPNPYDEYKAYLDAAIYDYQGSNPDPLGTLARGEPAMSADRVIAFATDTNQALGTGTAFTPGYEAVAGLNFNAIFARGRPAVVTWQRTTLDETDPTLNPLPPTGGGPPPGTLDPSNPAVPFGAIGGTNGGRPDPDGNLASVRAFPDLAYSDNNFGNNPAWVTYTQPSLERITQIEVIELPSGIAVELINGVGLETDTTGTPPGSFVGVQGAIPDGAASGNAFIERYVRSGAILFSPQGRLVRRSYQVFPGSQLGIDVNLAAAGTGAYESVSHVGVVLYATDSFDDAQSDGTATEWGGNRGLSAVNGTVIPNFETTIGDWNQALPAVDRPPTRNDEYAEERWIDNNTTPLLVNRFSGQLSESE